MNDLYILLLAITGGKVNQVIPDCPQKILHLIFTMWSWLYFCVANLLKENREKKVFGQAAVWRTDPVYCGADQEVMKKGEVLPVKKKNIFRRSRQAGQSVKPLGADKACLNYVMRGNLRLTQLK